MRVLIADNSKLFHEVITNLFSGTSLKPEMAVSGAAALTAIAKEPFACICSSYYLEDMTGVELCQAARKLHGTAYTPFILFTSHSPVTLMQEAYIAGVTDIFNKQDMEQLVVFIRRLLFHYEPFSGHVMVVDDSDAQSEYYTRTLEERGLSVVRVSSGEAALMRLEHESFDLVVTDIVLGGHMSGVTLVNQIRRFKDGRGEVPILAITAFDDLARRIELFHLGVSDYVIKPLIGEELIARARNLITAWRYMQRIRVERDDAVTEREKAHRLLEFRASHDPVTQVHNRWYFEEYLADMLCSEDEASRHMLLLVDVLTLGQANELGGHACGDALLQEAARRLRQALPERDTAARLEGGRLALLLRSDGNTESMEKTIAQLQAGLAGPFVWEGKSVPVELAVRGLPSLLGIERPGDALQRIELGQN